MKTLQEHFNSESNKVVDGPGTFYYNSIDQLHREDGPALEYKNGTKGWYQNGKFHRADGPAIEHANGTTKWYLNGKRHRTDGPATIYKNGDQEWWLNGKFHREDGPAVEYANIGKEWYINGIKYTLEEYTKQIKLLNTVKQGTQQAGLNLDI